MNDTYSQKKGTTHQVWLYFTTIFIKEFQIFLISSLSINSKSKGYYVKPENFMFVGVVTLRYHYHTKGCNLPQTIDFDKTSKTYVSIFKCAVSL